MNYTLLAVVLGSTMVACSPSDLVEVKSPSGILDKGLVESPAGAMASYQNARSLLSLAVSGGPMIPQANYVLATGVFTDEMRQGSYGSMDPLLDSRNILTPSAGTTYATDVLYMHLQYARVNARIASDGVSRYLPTDPVLHGNTLAIEGYTEILLADFFCSGIPLSAVSIDGDFQYAAGSSTKEVYEHALMLFDSAIALSAGNSQAQHFGRMGRARALLNLGRYADAAATVASVPTTYLYTLEHSPNISGGAHFIGNNSAWISIPEREGTNGMPWISENDPRVGVQSGLYGLFVPAKYSSPFARTRLASGIEARLIEAEASLHAGEGTWLELLNTLRTNGTFSVTNNDTTWGLGTGRVEGQIRGLRPLLDPGTPAARINLLYRERAFWLYATGQRQGDLRRLVRNYERPEASVYPSGAMTAPTPISGLPFPVYGRDVVARVSMSEVNSNPRYTGCINTNA